MVFPNEENLVHGIKLSSVGPGRVTGSHVVHNPSSMDLAMKLHYLRGVYLFSRQAAEGLTIPNIKEAMFGLCNEYYYSNGRFRRLESGRPYIKCNDCGVRFIEAQCDKTVDEWLEMKDLSLNKLLVFHQAIGPELSYSPPVLVQVTRFNCGGMSLGLSWAHVLGDAYTASDIINRWGQLMADLRPNSPPNFHRSGTQNGKSKNPPPTSKEPFCLKRVDPVGDHWITANNCKMETFSFHITASQLTTFQSEFFGENQIHKIPIFESLCAIIWKCIAKVRRGTEPKIVTICKNDPTKSTNGIFTNSQIISVVKADFSVIDKDPEKLATFLVDKAVDERSKIEEQVEKDDGVSDFIVYGANLTFVDLEEANFYGLELNGYKPEFVHYTIQGVGDEGAVLVHRGPNGSGKDGSEGRVVTIILPESQVLELKIELEKKGLLLGSYLG